MIDLNLYKRCTEVVSKASNAALVATITLQHHTTLYCRYHCKMIPAIKGGSNLRKGDSFHAGIRDMDIKESYSD